MKRLINIFMGIIFTCLLLACGKGEEGIDVEKALRYQVEKESGGKLALVSFKEISSKQDNAQEPSVHAVTYQATIYSKDDLRWGTSNENKLSRFVPYEVESNFGYQNREVTKAGEKRDVEYTIIFTKKDGKWMDQFNKIH